ncbi:MAG TPA: hypothetical protein VD926_01035 [Acidimicrobiales bacterium]|nr:hypothetical protein [Acidimicrobiales bacterium]
MSDISAAPAATEAPAAPASAPVAETAPGDAGASAATASIVSSVTANAGTPTAPKGTDATPAHKGGDDDGVFGEHAPYVKQLRGEAAKYRTELGQYKDVFGSWADEDRAAWLGFSRDVAAVLAGTASPELRAAVVANLEGLTTGLKGTQAEAQRAATDAIQQPPAGLTQEDVKRAIAEHDARKEAEQRIKDLGYKPGTDDYRDLVTFAAENGGDLEAAHAKVEARKKAIVDAYVASLNKPNLPSPVQTGGPASEAKPVRTFGDARKSVKARLTAGPAV